jgi:hypothetical protein
MVGFPKQSFTLSRVGNGLVLEGWFVRNRNLNHRPSAGLQYPKQFVHCLSIFRNMLQNMAAQNDVE